MNTDANFFALIAFLILADMFMTFTKDERPRITVESDEYLEILHEYIWKCATMIQREIEEKHNGQIESGDLERSLNELVEDGLVEKQWSREVYLPNGLLYRELEFKLKGEPSPEDMRIPRLPHGGVRPHTPRFIPTH